MISEIASCVTICKIKNSKTSLLPPLWFPPIFLDGLLKKKKKGVVGRRESKDFVDTSENVFETLNVKYRSRFPSGIATFARGPHRVYSSPD